jgi:hypothetical protein
MWKYSKNERARYDSAEICNPADYPELTSYAVEVARAVGIQYGAAHVGSKHYWEMAVCTQTRQ